MQKLLSILIILLFALPGLAATIYVKDDPNNSGTKICYKSGGWADSTCSDGTSSDIETTYAQAGVNGTIILARGTYVGTQLAADSSIAVGTNGVTTRAATASDPLDNGTSRAGTVVINGNNAAAHPFNITATDCIFQGFTLTQPGSTKYGIIVKGGGNIFNDINITKGNGAENSYGISLQGTSASTAVTFNRVVIDGGFIHFNAQNANLTPTYNYCKSIGGITTGYNYQAIFNNMLFIGYPGRVLYTSANTGAAITWNNPIFYANGITNDSVDILKRTHDQTWTINNGLLQGNARDDDDHGFTGVTINNSLRGYDPRFVSDRYPSGLIFGVDDITNLDWFRDSVIPLLEARGMRGVFAVLTEYGGVVLTATEKTKLIDLESRGHEIAIHGRHHVDVSGNTAAFTVARTGYTCGTDSPVTTLTCTNGVTPNAYTLASHTMATLRTQMNTDGYTVGALEANYTYVPAALLDYITPGTSIASATTLGASRSVITLQKAGYTCGLASGTLTCTDGETTHNYTLASYTIRTLRIAMIADGYTVGEVHGGNEYTPATVLGDMPEGTSINATHAVLMDLSRLRCEEIDNARADLIAAGIHGVNGDNKFTFVAPYNSTNAGLRKYLLDTGFIIGARDNGVAAIASIAAYDVYFTSTLASSLAFTDFNACTATGETEANCIKRNVVGWIGYLKYIGGYAYFMAHDSSGWNADQWTAMLDAVSQSGIPVYTFTAAVEFIKTYNPSGDLATADGRTYTRTLIDQSDYHLRSGSPAINAGVDVGLTTDADGKPIIGLPDIGAYEYQPTAGIPAGLLMCQ